jgi:hypothetical protein
MSLFRDDRRTRSEAVELPRGECGRGTAREHREDGADDHSLTERQQTRESVRKQRGHSLAAAQPHQSG